VQCCGWVGRQLPLECACELATLIPCFGLDLSLVTQPFIGTTTNQLVQPPIGTTTNGSFGHSLLESSNTPAWHNRQPVSTATHWDNHQLVQPPIGTATNGSFGHSLLESSNTPAWKTSDVLSIAYSTCTTQSYVIQNSSFASPTRHVRARESHHQHNDSAFARPRAAKPTTVNIRLHTRHPEPSHSYMRCALSLPGSHSYTAHSRQQALAHSDPLQILIHP
jgi:hypothetical protein